MQSGLDPKHSVSESVVEVDEDERGRGRTAGLAQVGLLETAEDAGEEATVQGVVF